MEGSSWICGSTRSILRRRVELATDRGRVPALFGCARDQPRVEAIEVSACAVPRDLGSPPGKTRYEAGACAEILADECGTEEDAVVTATAERRITGADPQTYSWACTTAWSKIVGASERQFSGAFGDSTRADRRRHHRGRGRDVDGGGSRRVELGSEGCARDRGRAPALGIDRRRAAFPNPPLALLRVVVGASYLAGALCRCSRFLGCAQRACRRLIGARTAVMWP